jgi:peroxin-2
MTTNQNNNIQYVLRVTQLDSTELDDLLLVNLKQSLNQDYFKYIQINFLQKYNVELIAFIKFILWYNTFYKTGQTVGQSIMDWSYLNGSSMFKKLVHCFFYCFDEWIEERVPQVAKKIYIHFNKSNFNGEQNQNQTRSIDKYVEYFKAFFKLATFLNYLTFLYNGKYLHLWQRFVKMRPIYKNMQFMRENDTKINEREELWQSYFILFKLINSLIDFKKLKKKLTRILPVDSNKYLSSLQIDLKTCGICQKEPTMVHSSIDYSKITSCKHVFCYYCIKKYLKENNQQYFCTICSKYVNEIEIYLKNSTI